jgi:hypothetical protein
MLASLLFTTAGSANDDLKLKLSTAVDFTSGEYGGADDIEDTYIPVTLSAETGRLGFRVTIPHLSVRAPSGTIITDPGGDPVLGPGPLKTERGLGDIIGAVTLYDVVNDRDLGIALDLTAKIKFATADEDKGLGTGENDYSIQADVYKYLDDLTLLVSGGYKVRGDPSGLDLENVLFASVGGVYQFASRTRGGLIYDFRESAFSSGDDIQELTGFVSQQLSDAWRIQAHVLTGFGDASPDWGGGVLIKYAF